MENITLNWKVVQNAEDFNLSDVTSYLKSHGGVYLWIIGSEDRHVCYVGKASIFWDRFITHFTNIIAGLYICYYPEENENFIKYLHTNYAGKKFYDLATSNKSIYMPTAHHPEHFHEGIKNTFLDLSSIEKRVTFLKNLKFAFASINSDSAQSSICYEHVESAIILGLKKHYDPDNVIRLKQCAKMSRIDRGSYIGKISKYPANSFKITHINDSKNKGIIPPEVFTIARYPM